MARPEYVNGGDSPSIETWQEACVISQEWADDARLAAAKRRGRRLLISTILMGGITLALAALLIILLFDITL